MADLPNIPWREFLADPCERNFIPIYEACKGMAWTLCVRITGRNDDAMDAFQSTWCRLLAEAKNRVDRSLDFADCRQTVYRLAIREAQNLRKRSHRRAGKELAVETFDAIPSGDPPADEQAARNQLREQLETIVRLLPEELRLTMQLNLFHGLSQSEISRTLNVTQGTVSRRLNKGMKEVGKLLRRAGLADAMKGAATLGAGAMILAPPEAFSASVIFAGAQTALAASAVAAATTGIGAAGATISSGLLIMKTKIGIVVAIAAMGLIGITGTMAVHNIVSAPAGHNTTISQSKIAAANLQKSLPAVKTVHTSATTSSMEKWAITSMATTAPTTGSTIVGQVIDAETKRPIAGAVVTVKKLKAESDARGFYKLKGIAGRQVNAEAFASGYARRTAIINVNPKNAAVHNFALDPGMNIIVQVNDTEGSPIEGATIEAIGIREGFIDTVGKTDHSGKTFLPAMSKLKPPSLWARKAGYRQPEELSNNLEMSPRTNSASIKFVLEKVDDMMRAITGRITDNQDKPVRGVTVQWSPVMGVSEGRDKVVTDENGNYVLVFENEAKECRLSVFAEGWAPAIREGVITGTTEKPAVENFSIEKGHWLSGTVVDETDKPVAGAGLYVMPVNMSGRNWSYPGVFRTAKTDANGQFSLKDLSGPRVSIEIRKRGWTELAKNDQSVDQDVKFTLKHNGVITGRVIDKETGQAIPTFNIKLHGNGISVDRINPGESFTSPDGSFVLRDLPQDSLVELDISATGYIHFEKKNLRSSPEAKATPLIVKLSRGRELTGFLVDAAANSPIKDARVDYGVWDGSPFHWANVAGHRGLANHQKMITDAGGRFQFKEDDLGTLFILAKGYRHTIVKPEDRARFRMDQNTLWIPLNKGESIHGTFYQNGRPSKGTLVLIRAAEPQHTIGTLDVRENGTYECGDLEPGVYDFLSIWSFADKFPQSSTNVLRRFELKEGESKRVDFGDDLGSLTWSGRVLTPAGEPVYRVNLVLKPEFDWSYSHFNAPIRSSNGSRFIFPNLKPGRYSLEIKDSSSGVQKTKSLPSIEITGNVERDLQVEPVR